MKKLARKFLAMLLTAAIAVSGLVVTSVTAGAKGVFDGAEKLEALDVVSVEFDKLAESRYYEIDVPRNGSLMIRYSRRRGTLGRLLKADGSNIFEMWTLDKDTNYSSREIEVSKGKYYLEIYSLGSSSDYYMNDIYYSFKPAKAAVITFSSTMKKGEKLQLYAATENYDGNVTWSSTKKSVATVSDKGLVTAKKAGTTYIRAQLDNGDYVEIKVVVKNK